MTNKELVQMFNADLEAARDAYYKKAEPIMTDAEYDAMEKSLRNLITVFPGLAEFAPVLKTVGSDLTSSGRIKHAVPMLSIENQYTEEDFTGQYDKWGANMPVVLEPKFDGISVSILYLNGVLERALTRGDGTSGENITAAVKAVKSIPQTLPIDVFTSQCEIRGELVMANATLERINREAAAIGGKQYSSTRNLTAGTMKQRDMDIVASRDILLMPWDVLSVSAWKDGKQLLPDSRYERLLLLSEHGFEEPKGIRCFLRDAIIPALHILLKHNKERAVNCDGVVMKVDSVTACKELGNGSKYTNWQTCFKPQSASGTTYLREIQWQVGRTGVISPVAKCDVVVLASANVTSASLNNITFIRKMGLKLGAKVEMLRSGDVIPQIVRVIDDGDEEINPPTHCPECNSLTELRDEGGQGIIQCFCTSPFCPAQIIGYLSFVGSRDVLEIDGLGPEMARKLVEGEFTRDLAELYEFQQDMMNILTKFDEETLIRGGRKKGFDATLPKMVRSLEKAKTAPWERWIKALGIPMIGETLGKVVASTLDLQEKSMATLDVDLILFAGKEVDGFGEAKMSAIRSWAERNGELCRKLYGLGIRPTPMEKVVVAEGAPLKGVVFCITGEFSEDRDALTKKLVALGAEAKSGVTKKINLLIVGESAGKTKLTKAKELGIKQVGKEWLEQALGGLKPDTFAAERA